MTAHSFLVQSPRPRKTGSETRDSLLPVCLSGKSGNLEALSWFQHLKAVGSCWVLLTPGSDELLMWKCSAERVGDVSTANRRRFHSVIFDVNCGCQSPEATAGSEPDGSVRTRPGVTLGQDVITQWASVEGRTDGDHSVLCPHFTFYRSTEVLNGFVKFCIFISSWLNVDKI